MKPKLRILLSLLGSALLSNAGDQSPNAAAETRYLTFQVPLEAHDQRERIARGSHRLSVIRVDRFAKRVARKANGE